MKRFFKMLNNKNVAAFLVVFILVSMIFLPEQYRKLKYGRFVECGKLNEERIHGSSSVLYGDYIITYDRSIETYNIKTKESVTRYDMTKLLKTSHQDVIKPWNDYIVVYRNGFNMLYDKTIIKVLYYNMKTNKLERVISAKYSNGYDNFSLLNNGDFVLYGDYTKSKNVAGIYKLENLAEKYDYKNNTITKIPPAHSLSIIGNARKEIPLKGNSFLAINRRDADIYKDGKFIPLSGVYILANDFTTNVKIEANHGVTVPLTDNKFAFFVYDRANHMNRITIYQVKGLKIEEIQKFETKKIRYGFPGGAIKKINDDEIIILSGLGGWYPLLSYHSERVYIYNIKKNSLKRISSLGRFLSFRVTDVFVANGDIYLISGKSIKVLKLK